MPDPLTFSTAISILKKLKEIGDRIKDAELKSVIADLTLELAEVKTRLAGVLEENIALKEQAKALAADGDPCPRCRKRTWSVESSEPDKTFGPLGGIRRTYRCSECGFVEKKLVDQ